MSTGFEIEVDSDGVALVTMDMRGQAVNLMNEVYAQLMERTLQQLADVQPLLLARPRRSQKRKIADTQRRAQ